MESAPHWDHPQVRGYYSSPTATLGRDFGLQVFLYSRENGVTDVPPFLVLISDGGQFQYISAGTMADAMDLMSRWSTAVIADILTGLVSGDRAGLITSLLRSVRASEFAIDSETP